MSGEQMSSEVKKFCNDIGTSLRALEEGTPGSNKAESYIGLIKEAVQKDIYESNSPLCFWDYCVERRARINNLTANDAFRLHGSTPHTLTTGDEGDISNLCQYAWYEWCYFRDQTAAFPNNKEVLGRVLGPARGAGNEMAQWILKVNHPYLLSLDCLEQPLHILLHLYLISPHGFHLSTKFPLLLCSCLLDLSCWASL